MSWFLILSGSLSAAAAAWWGTRFFSKRAYVRHIETLEQKVLQAEGQATQFKQQIGSLRGEVVSLQKTLSEERISKQESLAALSQSFQRAFLGISIVGFIMGGVMTGGISWIAAGWRAEAKFAVQNTDQRIQFELTKLKLELLEKQFGQSEKDRAHFQSAWEKEQILRTAAETRLETLMGGLALPQSLGGLPIDPPKLESKSENSVKKNPFPEDFSLLKQIPFKP